MLIFLVDMFIKIRGQKQALGQRIQVQNQNLAIKRNSRLQKQLFALMLSSIAIFLTTTLPVNIYRAVFPRQIISVPVSQFGSIAKISACLTWFWGFNYAVSRSYKNHKINMIVFR